MNEAINLELIKENIELRKALFLLKNQVHKLSDNEARVNTQQTLRSKKNRGISLAGIKTTKPDVYSPIRSELDERVYDVVDKILLNLTKSDDPILYR